MIFHDFVILQIRVWNPQVRRLLKSHFGMSVLQYICYIFWEQLFPKTTKEGNLCNTFSGSAERYKKDWIQRFVILKRIY